MECLSFEQKIYSDEIPRNSERLARTGITGSYFENFKNMMEDLSFEARSIEFKNPLSPVIDDRLTYVTEIDRHNIRGWVLSIEELHKITKTELSVKWLVFLKKYRNHWD